jgi:hypothetical protein
MSRPPRPHTEGCRWRSCTRGRAGAEDFRASAPCGLTRPTAAICWISPPADLVDENAAEALIQRSERACLLVVGQRDETTPGHSWGTTAAYVAHHSRCPLLVSRGPNNLRGPVVVAASGRHSATIGCAYEAASRAGSPLVAVHVWEPPRSDADVEGDRRKAEESVTGALNDWCATWPGVEVERLLIGESDVAYTLERASRRGRLLVAGRGRKGWFVEMLYSIGGLSAGGRRLCPVLLVPPGWPGTSTAQAAPARSGRS